MFSIRREIRKRGPCTGFDEKPLHGLAGCYQQMPSVRPVMLVGLLMKPTRSITCLPSGACWARARNCSSRLPRTMMSALSITFWKSALSSDDTCGIFDSM
ncbi:hypothetical protein D3C76_1049720 [compost metagenome]